MPPPVSDLRPLLEAGSVAIVGASNRADTVGNRAVRQIIGGGFSGRVVAVNPRYQEVEGIPCVPTIAEAGPVDLAVLAVANGLLEEQTQATVAAGARSLTIFASCHGQAEGGLPLMARLAELAASRPVCGGNGMGFLNLDRNLRVCGFHQPWDLKAGPITFLSHSGSLFSAMLHNHRHLRFGLVVSVGNELTTTIDRYVEYALTAPTTGVIGMFIEAVRNPAGLSAAWREAADRDIPIVALKVGRTERGARAVATHSAALAGEHGPFVAFAEAHGVHLVDTLDEMADTLAIFSNRRRAPVRSLGSVHDSGGERTLLIDLAASSGVPLAALNDESRTRLVEVLDPGLEPENPIDAWGTGREANEVFGQSLEVLANDPGVGVVGLAVDLTADETPSESYAMVAIDLLNRTDKPVVVLANLAGAVDDGESALLAAAGVPVLRGTATGLKAIGHLLDHRPRPRPSAGPAPAVAGNWRGRLQAGQLTDLETLELIDGFGIPVIRSVPVTTRAEAVTAALALGYPVALKATGIPHKSEVGGVALANTNEADLTNAFSRLSDLSDVLLVQKMAPTGIEMALGVITDPQYGSIVVVASGGILIELVDDRALALAPIDRSDALALLQRLRSWPLLNGYRGSPSLDIAALAGAVVAVSTIATHLGDEIASLDINPLIVYRDGVVAVDALLDLRSRA